MNTDPEKQITDQIWDEYKRQTAPLEEAYQQACDEAQIQRQSVIDKAVEEYHRAVQEADEHYATAQLKAWQDYARASADFKKERDAQLDSHRATLIQRYQPQLAELPQVLTPGQYHIERNPDGELEFRPTIKSEHGPEVAISSDKTEIIRKPAARRPAAKKPVDKPAGPAR